MERFHGSFASAPLYAGNARVSMRGFKLVQKTARGRMLLDCGLRLRTGLLVILLTVSTAVNSFR
jgi:hypothetical protein